MALSFSTGCKDGLLDEEDFKTMFTDGLIRVYSGTVPADADADLTGATLLVTYTDNDQAVGAGNGLDFGDAASGAIAKDAAQTWSGTSVAGPATATFWRLIQQADTGASSTTEKRIQGTVGGAGADLFVQSTTFQNATLYTIDYFSVSIPL